MIGMPAFQQTAALQQTIDEPAVVAGSKKSEGSIISFPAADFAQYHPDNALEMVKRIPGFTFQPGDPSLRGLALGAGNVVVGGRRLADKTLTLDELLEKIPAAQVERIDLVRGGGSGIDMLGQPMVVNVIRRTAVGSTGAYSASGAVYADGRVAPNVSVEHTRTYAGGDRLSVSASFGRYVVSDTGNGTRRRVTGAGQLIERANVDAAADGWTGAIQSALELPALGGQMRFNGSLKWTGYHDRQMDRTIGQDPVLRTIDERLGGLGGGQVDGEVGGHFNRPFGSRLTSETTIVARKSRKNYDSLLVAPEGATAFAERDRTTEMVARTKLQYQVTPDLAITSDVEAAYNRLGTGSRLSIGGVNLSLPNADARITEVRTDAGGRLSWNADRRLELVLGLHVETSTLHARADQIEHRRYSYMKPELALTLVPTVDQTVRLRLEREVGQLEFANFIAAATLDKGTVAAGNISIMPSNSWFAEFAYDLRLKSKVSLTMTYRHSWLRDVVDRIPVRSADGSLVSFDAPGNIGSGRADSLSVDLTLPLEKLGMAHSDVRLNATARRSAVIDPTDGSVRSVSLEKPFELSANFHQDLPRWKMAWGATFDAGWRSRTFFYDEVDTNRASVLLSLFADYNPRKGLSFHVDAGDLLGRRYERTIAFYDGLRGPSAPSYRDDRRLRLGSFVSIRARKSF